MKIHLWRLMCMCGFVRTCVCVYIVYGSVSLILMALRKIIGIRNTLIKTRTVTLESKIFADATLSDVIGS